MFDYCFLLVISHLCQTKLRLIFDATCAQFGAPILSCYFPNITHTYIGGVVASFRKDLTCKLCKGPVRVDRKLPFCSKKCESASNKVEEIKLLEHVKEGVNALSYKNFTHRNGKYEKFAVIGDTHFPFHCPVLIKKIVERIRITQPKFIIQVGDLYDYWSQSKYPKSLNLLTPQEEVLKGRLAAEEMWAAIHKVAPHAKKIQLKGNHDERPFKRMLEKAPELEPFFNIDHLFEFPQVETVQDSKQELVINGILFIHGWKKHGDHMKYSLMRTVHGHTHKASIIYHMLRGEIIWEADAGIAAATDSVPMGYGGKRWTDCTKGLLEIDDLGPRFIHESDL